jgi:hypothetical protein
MTPLQAFKDKVSRGEAQYATSGFDGKGFSFDAGEMNAEQKVSVFNPLFLQYYMHLTPSFYNIICI